MFTSWQWLAKTGRSNIVTCMLLCVLSSTSIQAQFDFNTDSVLSVARSIESKGDRLIYLDDVFHNIVNNNISTAEKVIFQRQDLVDQFGEVLPSIERAVDACDLFLRFRQISLADSVINRYFNRQDIEYAPLLLTKLLSAKGAIKSEEKKYKEAITYYEETLPLFNEASIPVELKPRILRNYGKNLVSVGRFGEASLALNESIKISKTLGDSSTVEQSLLELGILFSQLGLFDEAAGYILERQTFINPPFPLSDAIDDVNLGRNLILQNRYAEAVTMYERSLQIGPLQGDYAMLPLYSYNGLVESYYFLNEIDSVEHYFHKTKTLFEALGKDPTFEFLFLQSRWLYRLSKGEYRAAERDGIKLYQQALDKNDGAEILMYSKFFSELYRKSGQYEIALHYTQQYSNLRDSIHSANKAQALLLYQTQFETTEKENTILSLKAENVEQELKVRTNRFRFIAATLALLLIGVFLFLRQFYRNKIERAQQVERLRTKISSDLHDDVGSILTGLAMQTEIMEAVVPEQHKNSLSNIASMSRSAMAHMRDAVWAMDARNDTWGSLLDRMHEFAHETLEAKNISYQINSEGIVKQNTLNGEIRQNLYLIFKEALTNIIKHSQADRAEIKLIETNGKFNMHISDTGIGGSKENYSGQGLSNIKMRAEQIGAIAIIENSDGFKIVIQSK